MNIFKKQWEFIRPIWKILVVILIVQIIGGAIGKASNIYSDLFMSIWIGGAVSSFPRFLLGFVWQFTKRCIIVRTILNYLHGQEDRPP